MFVLAIRSGGKILEESHAFSDVVIFKSITHLPQREESLRERVVWRDVNTLRARPLLCISS
jgi:hypothetical protein